MSNSRNLADLASNDVIDTSATGVDITGTVTADGLTVDGNINVSAENVELQLTDTSSSNTTSISSNNFDSYVSADGRMFLRAGGSNDGMRIETTGNVGIGGSSPSAKLTVSGATIIGPATDTNGYLQVDGAGGAYLNLTATNGYISSDSNTIFNTNSTERARIDSAGRVYLGGTTVLNGFGGENISQFMYSGGESSYTAINTKTANAALYLSRTSDWANGAVLSFGSNGSGNGSIGVRDSSVYYTFNGSKGLTDDGVSNIVPCTSEGFKQPLGYMSLGSASYPFNNLYLQNAVYLNSDQNYINSDQTDGTKMRFYLNEYEIARVQRVGTSYGQFLVKGYNSAVYPSFANVDDTNTGMFFPDDNDTLGFTTGSTERARIDSSGNLIVNGTSSRGSAGKFIADGGSAVAGTRGVTETIVAGANGSFSVININFKGDSGNTTAIMDVQLAAYSGKAVDYCVMQYSSQPAVVTRNSVQGGVTATLSGNPNSGGGWQLSITGSMTHPVVTVKCTVGGLASSFTAAPTITFA